MIESPEGSLEVFGGMRYFGAKASTDWQLTASDWFVPYYLDVCSGSSNLAWRGLAGIGYGFRSGDITRAYCHLYYDQGSDKLIQQMRFSGPALGALFRF